MRVPENKFKIPYNGERTYACCIFWPAFRCCARQTLVQIVIFSVFAAKTLKKARNLHQISAKKQFFLSLHHYKLKRKQQIKNMLLFIRSETMEEKCIKIEWNKQEPRLFRALENCFHYLLYISTSWSKYTTTISGSRLVSIILMSLHIGSCD